MQARTCEATERARTTQTRKNPGSLPGSLARLVLIWRWFGHQCFAHHRPSSDLALALALGPTLTLAFTILKDFADFQSSFAWRMAICKT